MSNLGLGVTGAICYFMIAFCYSYMKFIEAVPPRVTAYEQPKVEEIRDFLKSRVVGQEEATDRIAQELVHVFSGLRINRQAPRGSILMMGPSGVGKTESALTAIEYLLQHSKVPETERDPEKFLIKIDCGAFSQEANVAMLMGSPPGYIGSKGAEGSKNVGEYTHPALGVEALEAHTFELQEGGSVSVVLLDEIEKAHKAVRNFLLAALDRGMAKTAANETVNFRNTLFFFTSNLGNHELAQLKQDDGKLDGATIAKIRRRALTAEFRPEDISRMSGSSDETVVFQALNREASEKILGIQLLSTENDFMRESINLEFQVTRAAKEELLNLGVNEDTGARALKAILKSKVYQPLLHPSKMENMKALGGKTVFIDYDAKTREFVFYTSLIDKLGEETPSDKDTSETKSKPEKPPIPIEFRSGVKEKLKELLVDFNPNTMIVRFLNYGVMHQMDFRKFAVENNVKSLRVELDTNNQVIFVFREKGGDSTFRLDKNGLPDKLNFDIEKIKNTKQVFYKWLTC